MAAAPQAPHVVCGVDVTPVFGPQGSVQLREEVMTIYAAHHSARRFVLFSIFDDVIFETVDCHAVAAVLRN